MILCFKTLDALLEKKFTARNSDKFNLKIKLKFKAKSSGWSSEN
jgi:hypothetical protein